MKVRRETLEDNWMKDTSHFRMEFQRRRTWRLRQEMTSLEDSRRR